MAVPHGSVVDGLGADYYPLRKRGLRLLMNGDGRVSKIWVELLHLGLNELDWFILRLLGGNNDPTFLHNLLQHQIAVLRLPLWLVRSHIVATRSLLIHRLFSTRKYIRAVKLGPHHMLRRPINQTLLRSPSLTKTRIHRSQLLWTALPTSFTRRYYIHILV